MSNVLDVSIPTVDIGSVRDVRCLLRAIIYRLNKALRFPLYMGVASDTNYASSLTPAMIGYSFPVAATVTSSASSWSTSISYVKISSVPIPIGKYLLTLHATIEQAYGAGTITGTPQYSNLTVSVRMNNSNASNTATDSSSQDSIMSGFTIPTGTVTATTLRIGLSQSVAFIKGSASVSAGNDYIYMQCALANGAVTGVTSSCSLRYYALVQRIG